jgi:hypothetical protein
MKKKTNIKTVIRQIVREEVAMAINEVISELKKPTQTKQKTKPVEGKRTYKKYSQNSVLNDVLNETAQDDDWKQMGDDTFTTDRMNEVMSGQYGDLMNGSSQQGGNLASEMGVNPNDPAMNFLNKDYRKVLKATEEKTKQKRGA